MKVAGGRFRANEMLCLTTQISERNSQPEDAVYSRKCMGSGSGEKN